MSDDFARNLLITWRRLRAAYDALMTIIFRADDLPVSMDEMLAVGGGIGAVEVSVRMIVMVSSAPTFEPVSHAIASSSRTPSSVSATSPYSFRIASAARSAACW